MEEKARELCIYTKQDGSEAEFKKREHIIPACIGGMKRLKQGYVSDEINHEFSKLELPFGRESISSIPRMFVGPGKRGSKNPKKKGGAGKKIAVMRSHESGKLSLGYIQMGKPIMIEQLHIKEMEDGQRRIGIGFDSVERDCVEKKLAEWMEKLDAYNGSPTIIKSKDILVNEMILGLEGKRWYLAIAEKKSSDEAKEGMKKELELLKKFYKKRDNGEEMLKSGAIHVEKSQVTAEMKMAFNMHAYFRVVAKIAFNCLADLKGQDYVLQEKFDAIRKAIVTGENIEQFVQLGGELKLFDGLAEWAIEKGFGSWMHMVLIIRSRRGLAAVVCLYGNSNPMAVYLSDEACQDFEEMDGLICDWEHKREMSFLDFIGAMVEAPNFDI